jgi:hypothetical protein
MPADHTPGRTGPATKPRPGGRIIRTWAIGTGVGITAHPDRQPNPDHRND